MTSAITVIIAQGVSSAIGSNEMTEGFVGLVAEWNVRNKAHK
jgi:hypothetical protein